MIMNKLTKILSVVLSLVLLLACFTACGKNDNKNDNADENPTENVYNDTGANENQSNEENSTVENSDEASEPSKNNDSSETPTQKPPVVNNQKPEPSTQKPSTGSDLEEDLKNSNVVTYYSDNPNNKYIKMVANKYGVDKSNLVALIKVNATFPGATVLEFTGDRDANGKLIFSKKTLVAMYDISDADGTIKCAHRDASKNDGYTAEESKKMFLIFELFALNSLNDMRENRVYPE